MRKVFPSVSYFFSQFLRAGILCWEQVVQVRGRRPRICDLFETLFLLERTGKTSNKNGQKLVMSFMDGPLSNYYYKNSWSCQNISKYSDIPWMSPHNLEYSLTDLNSISYFTLPTSQTGGSGLMSSTSFIICLGIMSLVWIRRELSSSLLPPNYADAHSQHDKKVDWHQNGKMN